MVDAEDDHLAGGFVDAVQDAVGAATGGMDAGEVSAQGLAHPMRVADQRAREELDDGRRHGLRKLVLQGPDYRWGQDQFVRLRGFGHRRSARTASTPRTTSPRA